MTAAHPFQLEMPRGGVVHGIVDTCDLPGPRPTVVICHGFKGFQEWGFFPSLAELLAQRGFTAIRFNFTGSGMRPGDERVTDLEAFRSATVGRDLEELAAVVGAAGHRIANGRVDRRRLGLFGHSRGGGTALLVAARGALRREVRALVTWSAVATFDRLGEPEKEAWRRDGEVTIRNARTGQELPMGLEILTELEARAEEFDLEAAAARRVAPWLIVHGAEDETVPAQEAVELAGAARAPVRLAMIPEASHTFNARHPFAGPTPQLIEALNLTQNWFREYLPPVPVASSAAAR